MSLVKAHRSHGHLAARLDPLGSEPPGDPALSAENVGLTPEIMARTPAALLRVKVPGESFAAALPHLRDAYCSTIAYEIEHLSDHQKRLWLRGVIEAGRLREPLPAERRIANLERLTDRPVYITENGCAATDDRFRIVYLALTLSALSEALDRGVDVRGYFYWSLLDNYEWGSFIPKFGLVAVNPVTFARAPKPSAAKLTE